MAVTSGQITVGTTATLIVSAVGNGERVHVFNEGGASVYLGPAGVTTSTGYELENRSGIELVLEPGESLYGVVATGTEVVDYITV